MGWWWKSDPQTPVLHPSDPTPDPLPTASQPPASPREIADAPAQTPSRYDDPPPTKPRSRDDQADAELSSFLAELASAGSRQRGAGSSGRDDAAVPSTAGTSISVSTSTLTTPQPPLKTAGSPDDLTPYPSTMSCRAAFDSAFYCQSLGGQFNAIYRHGQLRSCAPLWSDFWFCMRLKSFEEEERKEMVRGRYREKEEIVRRGRNSEEVWVRRARGEEVGRAFHLDPDEVIEEG